MLILGMRAKNRSGNRNYMTSRERCFEASFYELCKALFKFCFFEEFNIGNHVASITLGKGKKPLFTGPGK